MDLVTITISREPTEIQRATIKYLLSEAVARICEGAPEGLRETARSNGMMIASAALAGLPVPPKVASFVSKALAAVGCDAVIAQA
jgi:hypothetical protein